MSTETVDTTEPQGKWTFDADVTAAFDDMLRRSIPQYDLMRQLCFDLGSRFVKHATTIVDLGCSRGEAMAPFVHRFGAQVHHVGVEISPTMREAAKERFGGMIRCGVVEIRDDDLRTGYPPVKASLTLCVLTLQFVPIEYRQRLLRKMWDSTLPGGALVLVEKVIGSCQETDQLLIDAYHEMKKANGYSQEAIDRKRLSLEGVLVPVTSKWNEDLLQAAGFRRVEGFWRCLNFAGWIAVKD